jgi:DNA invertase Pin-like site-specific DNA recombinase
MAGYAAIYARISKDAEGHSYGTQRQVQLCEELAARQELEVVDIFVDNDIGASTRSRPRARPQYARMLELAREGLFTAIVTYSNSRLTRRPQEYNELIEVAERHRIGIVTVASGQHDLGTADGRAIARTIAAWDAAESERLSERVKAALRQRAEQGRYHGGPIPFGYRRGEGKLVLVPAEAALIRRAARDVIQGVSLGAIAREWNASGHVRGVGRTWSGELVRRALTNSATTGTTSAGVRGWTPLFDTELRARLHARLTESSRSFKAGMGPRPRRISYSLGGRLTICGNCGNCLLISNSGRMYCDRFLATSGVACSLNSFPHRYLQTYVLDLICDRLRQNPPPRLRIHPTLQKLAASLDDLGRREDGLVRRRYRVDQDSLDAELEEINRERASIRGTIRAALAAATLGDVVASGTEWRSWSPSARHSFLRMSVSNVVLFPVPRDALPPRRRRGAVSEGVSDDDILVSDEHRTMLRQNVRLIGLDGSLLG